MRIQRLKWYLWGTGTGLYALAAFLLIWAVFWPCSEREQLSDLEIALPAKADVADPSPRRIGVEQFAALWSKRLRAPLKSSPQPAEENRSQMEVPEQMLTFTLRGTIVEKGHSVAIFATTESAVELRGIGELVGDSGDEAEVVDIQRDQVVLRYQGELVKLPFPESEGS